MNLYFCFKSTIAHRALPEKPLNTFITILTMWYKKNNTFSTIKCRYCIDLNRWYGKSRRIDSFAVLWCVRQIHISLYILKSVCLSVLRC